MTHYRFEALDDSGQREQGTLEADSPRQARTMLRSRGLSPIRVRAESTGVGTGLGHWIQRRLSGRERVLITRQLAVLLGGGVPLDEALAGVAAEAEREGVRQRLLKIRAEVVAGSPLAQALGQFPRDFPSLYPALVAAGEKSGRLAWVLERLADYAAAQDHLSGKVLGALAYPVVLMGVATAIVLFLMSSVVPQVVGVFASNHQTLPTLTRVLIFLSDGIRQWGLWGLAGMGMLAWGGLHLWRKPALRLRWDRHVLAWPLVGRLGLSYDTERLASTLAILVGGGVPLLSALQGAAQAVHNRALRQALLEALERVREGSGLARALEASMLFPRTLMQLIQAGERTGRLDDLLTQAARHEGQQLERRLMLLTTLLEPALILLMGGVVGLIVLAILMPIMDLNQMVQ
ncbi:type II secretion system inner membrane protein GspF [Ferrovum sp.]|uniref:type II secretion system inner membrane protein GspF n=1 Tax=Ferrovum sp. TaxID=2609467 RepID=UPI002602416D|nr:type II secretion system inner membrane protein GspF [Ferrovum sp.]